jgi:hypothetical protein
VSRPGARALLVVALTSVALTSVARAASPNLEQVLPRGGQRGTAVKVTLRGDRLHDAEELLFYGPGLTAASIAVVNTKTLTATLAIAPDCALGEHALRVRTRSGLSELRTFWVGALPIVAEAEPNSDVAKAQAVPLDVTIEGAVGPEDVDAFAFVGRAGQRVTAEVEAMRLGGPVFDPVLSILDAAGAEVAGGDDASLLGQDGVASAVLAADGRYVVTLRDAAYAGGDRYRYRLHLGTFPRPTAAFPPGARAGEELSLELLGDVAGVLSERRAFAAPADPDDTTPLWVERDGAAPSPLRLRVGDLPGATEVEPNDRRRATEVTLPVALHGRLEAPGDEDWFRFSAKKGQRLRVRAWARGLGAPVDPVLNLFEKGGKDVGGNDDFQGQPDSELTAAIAKDGEYELRVRDFQGRGGPLHVYRVEVAPVTSRVTLDLQTYGRNSQARNSLSVPRGNRMAILVRVAREAVNGPVAVELAAGPAGVAAVQTLCAPGFATVPVVVEAALDAPLGAALARLTGRVLSGGGEEGGASSSSASELRQTIPLTFGAPNNAVYWTRTVDRLALAVTEPAPFRVTIVEPARLLPRGGAAQVEVLVERQAGFDRPVIVSLLQDSPGVASRKDVKVDGGADRAVISLTANDAAALGGWPLVAVARADHQGELWVSSQLATLQVIAPFVRLALPQAVGPRGATATLAGELHVDRAFTGEATARLVGLPPHCAAAPLTLTADARELRFTVTIGPEARLGRHRNIFCELVVVEDGRPVTHHVGRTELRVDAPQADAPPPPAPTSGTATRPLTRLEQLRAEHAARLARARAAAAAAAEREEAP